MVCFYVYVNDFVWRSHRGFSKYMINVGINLYKTRVRAGVFNPINPAIAIIMAQGLHRYNSPAD